MANAAFSTLVSQATVSTINNGGNLGAVLKEMGSSANIKQLATSVASAGALQGLDNAMGWASTAPATSNATRQPAASNLLSWDTFNRVTSHSAVTTGINTTINGSHFADAFKASLLSNIQGEVGKATANWIGDKGIKFDVANSSLAEAGKIAAHGVTSGAIAEITGGKFAAGAAGGAMSELASSWSSQIFSNTELQVALNKVLGGLAAVAVTDDQNQFDTGADRAETIYRYNNLQHLRLQFSAESKMEQIERDMAPIIERANEEARKEALKETVKAGVYVIGAAYIGPAASVGHVVTGASINTMANTAYQWFDITRVGNENKPWDYWGTVNSAVTGAVSPGRGIKHNI